MPNTLAHLGLQGMLSTRGFKDVDLKWVYLGCIIPDLPWILQRMVWSLWPTVDPYGIRLYSIAQSSLLSCLLLGACLALLTRTPRRVFLILGLNSLLHLLLDACQIKWANGVHFWAPFDWQLVRFDLFWPEQMPTWVLTIGGALFVLRFWRKALSVPFQWATANVGRWAIVTGLAALYVAAPLAQTHWAAAADNHFVNTLRQMSMRPGRPIEIDRVAFVPDTGQGHVRTFARESIRVAGVPLQKPATISLKGVFTTPHHIQVLSYHVHHSHLRALASYVGLGCVAALWALAVFRRRV